jgi:GDP-4-dehydro-6-deoxy-D-mannose reductase
MITILVTGANGFIGKVITSQLKRDGFNVIEMSRAIGDITDVATWNNMPVDSIVIHLAGITFIPNSWNNSPEFIRVNVLGTEHALNYCRRHNAALILSSTYVYGQPEHIPISENHPLQPSNPYALSKRMAESLCEFASRYNGITTTNLRLFNVFGNGQRSNFLIPSILEQIKTGNQIIVKDLESKRDYIYIDDVVDAFIKSTKLNDGKCRTFNIATGCSYSVKDVIDLIQIIKKKRFHVVSENDTQFSELTNVKASIELAKEQLNWQPKWTLEDGLRAMLDNKIIGADIDSSLTCPR